VNLGTAKLDKVQMDRYLQLKSMPIGGLPDLLFDRIYDVISSQDTSPRKVMETIANWIREGEPK